MLQELERILEEREVVGAASDKGIMVNVGTQFEEVSLRNINNFLGASSREWEAMQEFYSVPTFTREETVPAST